MGGWMGGGWMGDGWMGGGFFHRKGARAAKGMEPGCFIFFVPLCEFMGSVLLSTDYTDYRRFLINDNMCDLRVTYRRLMGFVFINH
jgi:hypothetical protein